MVSGARIFLLDLYPQNPLGTDLQNILESRCDFKVEVRREPYVLIEPLLITAEVSRVLSHFNPDVVILVLPDPELAQHHSIIAAIAQERAHPIIFFALEGAQFNEIIELMRAGASDFIIPPLKAVDIFARIWRWLEQRRKVDPLTHKLKERLGLRQLVGKSPIFLAEIEKIPAIGRCDASVLISGESGTGKELFARAIHYLSPRADKPFIPASCGAIPLELVENELFGHIQGAFTGASSSQSGLIQEAQGGTLFLDEIDCLPLLAQVKFLRFLQEKEYKQLGSAKVHHADVRVIAATNIELENVANGGRFRRDLYYRLNIISLILPPLRERKEDIPLLARHFIEKYALELNKQVEDITGEAVQKLMTYDWPGNVRELENMIERAVIFSKQVVIEREDISLSRQETKGAQESFKTAKARAIEQFERKYIQDLLLAHGGNISRAAEAVHKNRRAFWELIRKYKIDIPNLKTTLKSG